MIAHDACGKVRLTISCPVPLCFLQATAGKQQAAGQAKGRREARKKQFAAAEKAAAGKAAAAQAKAAAAQAKAAAAQEKATKAKTAAVAWIVLFGVAIMVALLAGYAYLAPSPVSACAPLPLCSPAPTRISCV